MDTFMDEIKNIKMLTRVVAGGVLINFVIIALFQGPDAVGFDPTYGTITSILNFVIAFCTSGVLMVIYVVFDVKKTFDRAHMHNVLFVAVWIQMILSLGSVVTYNSVFENILTASEVGAIGGSITNTIFFLYGMYAYLLVTRDHNNLLSSRTQTVGKVFAGIIVPVQALTLFGLIPAVVFAPLFILGGVVLYPLLMIGIGDAIGNYEQTNG